MTTDRRVEETLSNMTDWQLIALILAATGGLACLISDNPNNPYDD